MLAEFVPNSGGEPSNRSSTFLAALALAVAALGILAGSPSAQEAGQRVYGVGALVPVPGESVFAEAMSPEGNQN